MRQRLSDPEAIFGPFEDIVCFDERTVAAVYAAGVVYFKKNGQVWNQQVLRFGADEILEPGAGGSGSPKRVSFVDEMTVVVGYEFGRVVVWRFNEVQKRWVPEILRSGNEMDKLFDVKADRDRVYISTQNGMGRGVVEIYDLAD